MIVSSAVLVGLLIVRVLSPLGWLGRFTCLDDETEFGSSGVEMQIGRLG